MVRIGMALVIACAASTASAEDGAKPQPPAKPQPVKPQPVKPQPVKPQPVKPVPAKPVPAKPASAAKVTIEGKQALMKKSPVTAAVVKQLEAAGYLVAIRRCYGAELARSPSLRGQLVLAFQVTERGDTAAVRSASFDARLDACVAKQAASWKFQAATDREGRPAAARYEVTLQLEPAAEPSLEEQARSFADRLTAEPGTTSEGDLSSRRRPSSDLSGQIEAVREGGSQVRVGGGGGRGGRGGGGTGTGVGPGVSGPGSSGNAPPATPAGRVSVAGKQANDRSSLDSATVMRKILSAYMAGIKRCYKERLRVDPAARGTLVLVFEVNEAGRLVGGKARGMEASLGACVEGLMASWRFPIPKDDAGEPIAASFQVSLQLVPE